MRPEDVAASAEVSGARGSADRPLESEDLFRESKEVFIRHREELYRLTITRNNKLILQK
jgi:hemin uptake protein HemP